MQAVILAAGWGTRIGELGEVTPKPLLPLGRGCVIDSVLTSLWVEPVTQIRVVHNNHRSRVAGSWPKRFKTWAQSVRWTPEPGHNPEHPRIRLINDQVQDPEQKIGSVGDMAFAVRKNSRRDLPIVFACGDDIYSNSHLEELAGEGSAIVVRNVNDMDPLVESAKPSRVDVKAGMVDEVGLGAENTPWRFCGPLWLAGEDMGFLLEYADIWQKAGVVPDSIGEFIEALVSSGRPVRAVKASTFFWTVGNKDLYKMIKKRHAPIRREVRRLRRVNT